MSVIMSLIFRFAGNTHKHDDNQVRYQIRQRVYRIGNHRRTLSTETCCKLTDYQQNIDQTTHQGYLVNLTFANGCSNLIHILLL